jgi:hypothetical protein
MKKTFVLFLTFCIILICDRAAAQDSTEDKASSYAKVYLSYLSDNVYLGRKDSVRLPYISPSFAYYHKSGFFVSATTSYLPTESRMDAVVLSTGYSFSKKKWEGEFSIDKDFYSSKSYSVKSEITGSGNAYIACDLDFIKPSFNGTISFGANTDYSTCFGVEHDFAAFNDNLQISPSLLMNASTQNYYNDYYKKRKYAKTRKGKVVAYNVTANAVDASKFKVMDYEASVPLSYKANRFTFDFTPTYAIPVNPNNILYTIKSSNGQTVNRTNTEHIGNTFYWMVEVSYRL